jgi:hypothetical protein
MIYNNVKVDIKSYYQPNEINVLKQFVLDNLNFIKEQKLSNIANKIKRLKLR